jgi:hypothetical protein
MNEAALAVKNTLFAAAAAHSYRQQQVPDSSRASAEAFRQRGLPADCALDAGGHIHMHPAGFCSLYCSSACMHAGGGLGGMHALTAMFYTYACTAWHVCLYWCCHQTMFARVSR